jgi:hypothetical protein
VAFTESLVVGFTCISSNSWTHSCLPPGRKDSNIIHALLPSWIDDKKSDCCGWERVTCNSTTAHVIKLSLYNLKEEDPYNNRWLLNVSLLVPFKELTTLNLSGNAIRGCLPNEGKF